MNSEKFKSGCEVVGGILAIEFLIAGGIAMYKAIECIADVASDTVVDFVENRKALKELKKNKEL